MSIQGDIQELNRLDAEIKRLNKTAQFLRTQKKKVEQRIVQFLDTKDQPGVKYHGMAILTRDQVKHTYKSLKSKDSDILAVLRQYNIDNPESALADIKTALKGNETTVKKLDIQKILKQ